MINKAKFIYIRRRISFAIENLKKNIQYKFCHSKDVLSEGEIIKKSTEAMC